MQHHPRTPPEQSGSGSPRKKFFEKLSLFRLKAHHELEAGNVAHGEEDHLDHAHSPDKPNNGLKHLGNHKEAREPCVFKPHRDATSVTGGSGEERKTQDGRWYVN